MRVRRFVVGLLIAAPVVVGLPALEVMTDAASTAAAATAAPDACTPVSGEGPGACEVSLEPTPLPQRKVVGENELSVLTRSATASAPTPVSGIREFSAGGVAGSCDPATEFCTIGNAVDLSDVADGSAGTPVQVPDASFGSADADAAITAADLDGDGRQEIVRASGCRSAGGSLQLCLSSLTQGSAPGDPRYSPELQTGLNIDAAGAGRIRLAAGTLGLASADVIGATFQVDAAQESTVATFTTAARHSFQVGDPVRLGNDASLQATLCVESPLAKEGAQCIGEDLLSYHPITAVTSTTFSVDLGVLVLASNGIGRVVTPRPWSAGCEDCGVRAEALSTGVAVAWTAPTGSLRLATFTPITGADGLTFRLVDTRPIGTLLAPPAGLPVREPFDLVVDDFSKGGPEEIAVAWGGDCGQELPCPQLSFLALDDAKRLSLLSTGTFGSSRWCTASGADLDPGDWGLFSVSLTSGRFRVDSSLNPSPGADLGIGWVASDASGAATTYHAFQGFDVTPQLGLSPLAPLDPASQGADPSACATVTAQRNTTQAWALRSNLQVAAADLDGATGDEIVVAETLPGDLPNGVQDWEAPVSVSVWSQQAGDTAGPGWRAQSRLQPSHGWTQQFDPATPTITPTKGYVAVGDEGSGQVSLAVGRLARREAASSDTLAYPNAINPDIVVGWTCNKVATCGTNTPDTTAIAIDAIGVDVDASGVATLVRAGGADATVMEERAAATPHDNAGVSPERLSRTYVQVVTADLNGDSATLGDPIRSYSVGEVQPLMVLHAPPVEFAAIDGSHPGYDKDGRIASAEVYDLSGCYAGNGQNTDTGDCDMRTTYATDGTSEQSFSVTTQNSWGLDAAVKGGYAQGSHGLGGDCMDVCWEVTLELGYTHSEEQQTEAERAKSFSYSTEQPVAPMQDRAFVATSDIQMSQVPVYYGTFTGSLPAEPDLWTFSATPLDTVYSWISTRDPQYGSVFGGPVPGNVLSYPATAAKVPTAKTSVLSVRRESSTRLAVITSSNHGYLCALQANQVTTAFPRSNGSPCSGQNEPVRLQGAGAFDGNDYVVSTIRTPTQIVLQKIGSQLPVAANPCGSGGCTISRQPSALPVQTQEIGPGTSGTVSFRFGDVQGYSDRYAVSNGASAEAATQGETDAGPLWEAHVKGEFEHSDESMMGLVLESATQWTFAYAGASRPGSYRVTPYLADDPRNGALTLTWTAAPVGASGLWGNPQYGYGGVGDPDLPARPDPAFALPQLFEPYRVHTGLDDNLDVLLASPDFKTWECDSAGVCRPKTSVSPGRPLTMSATVHNYALTDLPAGVVVRFYLGDPARGGYPIAESTVGDPIPPRGEAEVTAKWTPPAGFAGQPGQPVYAVIDPGNRVDEVFDWAAPVVLWDRTLRGSVVSASTRMLDGQRVATYRTAVDHGVQVGEPVRIKGMGDYRRKTVSTVAVTPTSFSVPIGRKLKPSIEPGTWISALDDSCATNNPWYGNAVKDFYSFGGPVEFQSRCPTTNNEGFFLTPAFSGNRGAVTRTDLSVDADGISFTKDRKGVRVDVSSSAKLLGAKAQVKVWVCTTVGPCTPVDAGRAQSATATATLSVPAGGSTRVTVPFSRTVFGSGDYRVAAQVIPLTTWERPPGTGITDLSMGQYANNQATTRIVVP